MYTLNFWCLNPAVVSVCGCGCEGEISVPVQYSIIFVRATRLTIGALNIRTAQNSHVKPISIE